MAQSRWSMLGAALGGGMGQGIQSYAQNNPNLKIKMINQNLNALSNQGITLDDATRRNIIMQSVFGIKPESAFEKAIQAMQLQALGGNSAMLGGLGGASGLPMSTPGIVPGATPASNVPSNWGASDDPMKNPNFGKPLSQGGADGVATMIWRDYQGKLKNYPAGTQLGKDENDNVFFKTPDGRLFNADNGSEVR